MVTTSPVLRLLEFPHSHYCEKARWALDRKGVEYRRRALFPGLHRLRLRGLPSTSVPVLVDGHVAIQGSGAILDYLDRRYPAPPLAPARDTLRAECMEWERYLDREVGEHVRRVCYFHLLDRPDLVSYFFCYGQRAPWRIAFRAAYPLLKRKLVDAYDIRAAGAQRSTAALHRAIDRIGERLDGRDFLVGDTLSRADITGASMLSLLALPPEHPVAWPPLGAPAERAIEAFAQAPALAWVRRLYRCWRSPSAAPQPARGPSARHC